MKRLIWIIASAALAQQPQELPKKARIEGIVVSLAGGPVPRAQVRLSRRAAIQDGAVVPAVAFNTTSDNAGKFVIDDIDPGRIYNLEAQRPGFANARYGARSTLGPQASFSLDAGQSLTGLTLTMTPQSVVSGKVTDEDKDPVQGAMVILARRVYQRGGWQLVMHSSGTSNDLGEFRLPNVLPGRYTLVVSNRNNGAPPAAGSKVFVPTYYPNSTDFRGAAYLDIGAGQDLTGLDLRIEQSAVFSVRGRVAGNGSTTGPISLLASPKIETNTNMVIQQSVLTQLLRAEARVGDDGSFELRNLLPGPYIVQVVATQTPGTRGLGSFELNITNKNLVDLVIPVNSPVTLTGYVRLEDGDLEKALPPYNAANAQNSAATTVAATFSEAAVAGGRIAIALTDAAPVPVTVRPSAAVKPDGTFLLENVTPSRYQMTVAPLPASMYVKSARFGGADVTRGEIDLSAGGGGRIDIVLSDKAARVNGVVVDDKGESQPAIAVCLFPQEPDLGLINQGTRVFIADQNGQFQFQGLRPGTYYAVAFEDIEWGIARERAFLMSLTSEATKLDLSESERNSIRVKIIPVSKLKVAADKLP